MIEDVTKIQEIVNVNEMNPKKLNYLKKTQ